MSKILDYDDPEGVSRDAGDKMLFLCQDLNAALYEGRMTEVVRALTDSLVIGCLSGLFDETVLIGSELGSGSFEERYPVWESEVLARLNDSPDNSAPSIVGGIASLSTWDDFVGFLDIDMGFDMTKLGATGVYPMFIGASCDQGRYIEFSEIESEPYMPEMFLFEDGKGAIGWIGPTAGVSLGTSVHGNYWFSQALYPKLRETDRTVGGAFLDAKLECLERYRLEEDTFRSYALLGDPALVLFGNDDPYSDLSSVWEEPAAVGFTCPMGDGATTKLGTQLVNCNGDPVSDIPAEDIVAVASSDPGGSVLPCRGTEYSALSASDPEGNAYIEIPYVGGCGDLIIDVYAKDNFIGRETIAVRSPDLNGNCVVDSADANLFSDYFASGDPRADFDGNGVSESDSVIFNEHYAADGSIYHFSIHPGHSSANLTPSDPECLVLCPKGDLGSFSTVVIARNALNLGFPDSSIPADSIWAVIPEPPPEQEEHPEERDFRFLCRPDHTLAIADEPTWGPEKTTITVNSGGGHLERFIEYPTMYWGVETYIGGQMVDNPWTGRPKSTDIDASGSVNGTDISIWSGDYHTEHFRSDLDCSGQVGDEDFDVLNSHYRHGCGASSQMAAEGGAGPASWSVDDATEIRSHLPNRVLDRLLSKDLHPELRHLLEYVRSLEEPEHLADMDGKIQPASVERLPRVTALAQSSPNPFTAVALIKYQIAPPGGHVKIVIFDVAGRLARTLVDKETPPGFYVIPWDGTDEDGQTMPSGVYFYQMKAPGFVSNKRMMLVK